jgi:hypothetical protein
MQIRLTDFLAAFFPSLEEPICLRAFKAKGDPDPLPARKLQVTRRRLGEDAALQATLRAWNETLGLYFVVNAGGDSAEEIKRFNAFFAEIDDLSLAEQHQLFDRAPLRPSIRVETRKSVHAYWLLEGTCVAPEWRGVQEALIAYFQSDPKIKDPSRVMRLPHFHHIAIAEGGQRQYQRVKLVAFAAEQRYSVAQMQEAFGWRNADWGMRNEGTRREAECGTRNEIKTPSEVGGEPEQARSFFTPHSEIRTPQFADWSSLHTELRRRMLAHPTCHLRGEWAHLQGVCHNGKGPTALFLNLATNAFGCQKDPPCDSATILRAFGLPEMPQNNYDSSTKTYLDAPSSFIPHSEIRIPHSPQWPDPPAPVVWQGLIGEIIRAIDPHTEADPLALLIQLLVAFGSIIGRTAYFVADGSVHYLNLFAVLVGVSSKGRKGTSWAQVERLLRAVDPVWAEERVMSGLSSGEGAIWAVRDPISKTEVIRERGKPTGEYRDVLTDQGVGDKRLLIQEAEFAAVLRVLGREGNTLSAILRQAWDTGNLRVLTKNNPAKATGAHVSIIGHVTRDELRRYLDATEAGNGFGNRFLWLCVRRSKLLPLGGGEVAVGPFVQRLHDTLQLARGLGKMERDAAARELWCAVYPELSEGKPGLFGALTGRAEAQTMRLAALYALLDQSPLIRRLHLEAALALWQYCEDSTRFIFGDALGDPVADELLRVLREVGAVGLTRTQLHSFFGKHLSQAELSRALTALAAAGHAKCQLEPTGGRPTERWFALLPPSSPVVREEPALESPLLE